jgi:DNA modification methylase
MIAEQSTRQEIEISRIKIDLELQPRAQMNFITVAEYATAMTDGVAFPPVVVFFDGSDYFLADGFHRVVAARDYVGLTSFYADVRLGNRRDAILYSVGANAEHGLQRRTEDKRKAIQKLLDDPEWSQWSDREIARQCKVDHKTVSSLRPMHLGNSPDKKSNVRKATRNGKTYTVDTSNIGKTEPEPEPAFTLFNEPESNVVESPVAPKDEYVALADEWIADEESYDWSEPELQVIGNDELTEDEQVPEMSEEISEPESKPATPDEQPAITIINADAQYVSSLNIGSVQLVITSPPYNVGIDYNANDDNLTTYLELLKAVWRGCYEVMEDGARIAVVVPFGIGRNPYIPFDCQIMQTIIDADFELRGRIIWDKNTTGNRTSWGSFRLPSDPGIRDTTECIIVAHKGQSKLSLPESVKQKDAKGTYSEWLKDSDEFMALAQDHWEIAPESAKRVKHPAPFPIKLAENLIKFYAYPSAHVLDPFAGSGTVGVAAKRLGCNATLVDISAEYCSIAKERCNAANL